MPHCIPHKIISERLCPFIHSSSAVRLLCGSGRDEWRGERHPYFCEEIGVRIPYPFFLFFEPVLTISWLHTRSVFVCYSNTPYTEGIICFCLFLLFCKFSRCLPCPEVFPRGIIIREGAISILIFPPVALIDSFSGGYLWVFLCSAVYSSCCRFDRIRIVSDISQSFIDCCISEKWKKIYHSCIIRIPSLLSILRLFRLLGL